MKETTMNINAGKANGELNINFRNLRFKVSNGEKVGNTVTATTAVGVSVENATVGLTGEAGLTGIIKATKGAWKGNIQDTIAYFGSNDAPVNLDEHIDCRLVLNKVAIDVVRVNADYKAKWEDIDGGRNPEVISIDKTHERSGSVDCDTIELNGSLNSVARGLVEIKRSIYEAMSDEENSAVEQEQTTEVQSDIKTTRRNPFAPLDEIIADMQARQQR